MTGENGPKLRRKLPAVVLLSFISAAALAAENGELYAPSVWDLTLGKHARELPEDQFIDYACGTNGGPPARPIKDWAEFKLCRPEAETGFREVYFRYDDEPEYWARARDLATQIALYSGTTAYEMPVIVSALFDSDGFLAGIRLLSDPRAEASIRENGYMLGVYLHARYGEGWSCEDRPKSQGRTEIRGVYLDRGCSKYDAAGQSRVSLEMRHFRKSGQTAVDPITGVPTTGQLESSARLEVVYTGTIVNREQRLASFSVPELSVKDKIVERAKDCPGCDLRGVNFKRANLRGANLSGADLTGANLHAADLSEANLAGAKLTKANLNRIDMHGANLKHADLSETMAYGAKLNGAEMANANLSGMRARKSQFTRVNLSDALVSDADLREVRMGEADLTRANFTGSWLHDAQLGRAKLEKTVLAETVMWNANLAEANLHGAQIQFSDLFGADFRHADLTETDFSNSRLSRANLSGSNRTDAIFTGATMPDD